MFDTMELYVKTENMCTAKQEINQLGAKVINCVEMSKNNVLLVVDKQDVPKEKLIEIGYKHFN